MPYAASSPAGALNILGALSERPTLVESLGFQFTGLLVVFAALGTIWALLEVIGVFFKRAARQPTAAPAVAAAATPAAADAVTPEIAAVIAAAVHCAVGPNHRITSIAFATEHDRDWAREGRRQIFQSHQIR